jgi:hypothetical protein
MFDFDFFKRRNEVHRALTSRVNSACMEELRHTDRKTSRSVFSEVVWLVPLAGGKTPDYAQAQPTVSKDISVDGLSLLHNRPVEADAVVIVLPGDTGPTFMRCDVEHSTPLGFGFFQVGLRPERVVHVKSADERAWQRRCAEFEPVASV